LHEVQTFRQEGECFGNCHGNCTVASPLLETVDLITAHWMQCSQNSEIAIWS